MLQEDYLMRMIRLATTVFAHILGLKQIGSYQDAMAIIDQALEVIFGLSPALINSLDDESLTILLTSKNGLEVDKVLILAGLLKERGDIYAAIQQPDDSRLSYVRAINFYLDLFFTPAHIPPEVLTEKIEELLLLTKDQPLTEDLNYRVFFYYDQTRQYSRAIRQLDSLLSDARPDWEVVSQARAFYQRLLELPDEELAKAQTSRDALSTRLKQLIEPDRRV